MSPESYNSGGSPPGRGQGEGQQNREVVYLPTPSESNLPFRQRIERIVFHTRFNCFPVEDLKHRDRIQVRSPSEVETRALNWRSAPAGGFAAGKWTHLVTIASTRTPSTQVCAPRLFISAPRERTTQTVYKMGPFTLQQHLRA